MRTIFAKYSKTDKMKYVDFYQRHFNNLKPKTLLEIGVLDGDSLRIWQDVFPETRIVGIDRDQKIKDKHTDLEIFIGDQRDLDFLDRVINIIGIPNIVIDDGGHYMSMQVQSHSHIFPKLNPGDIYVIEDLNTSYVQEYNDSDLNTIDYLKSLIDTRKLTKITFEHNICIMVSG